jgi:hypothetical protein
VFCSIFLNIHFEDGYDSITQPLTMGILRGAITGERVAVVLIVPLGLLLLGILYLLARRRQLRKLEAREFKRRDTMMRGVLKAQRDVQSERDLLSTRWSHVEEQRGASAGARRGSWGGAWNSQRRGSALGELRRSCRTEAFSNMFPAMTRSSQGGGQRGADATPQVRPPQHREVEEDGLRT